MLLGVLVRSGSWTGQPGWDELPGEVRAALRGLAAVAGGSVRLD